MAKTGSQPFIDYYDDFYLGNITIGTPSTSTVLPRFSTTVMEKEEKSLVSRRAVVERDTQMRFQ